MYPLKDEIGKTEYLSQFPQVAIANKLAAQLKGLEEQFGMTPSARTRINVDVSRSNSCRDNSQNPKARFFNSGA